MIENQLTMNEKWKVDAEAYDNGAKVTTKYPQCDSCLYRVKGDALYCKKYVAERKPKEVLFAQKECFFYDPVDKLDKHFDSDIEKKMYGGVFGFVVGDMLGVPVEFTSRQERDADQVREMRAYGTYHQPFGSWSDDTSFTLCLLEALSGEDIIEKLKDNMIACYSNGMFTPGGQLFDIGISTRDAIVNMISGEKPTECGGVLESDNGNGSLMRVLPLAFVRERYNTQEYIKLVEDVSSVTHGHKRSKLACILYVFFASNLYAGMDKEEALDSAIRIVINECSAKYKTEWEHYRFVFDKSIIKADRIQVRSTGYVVDTLEAVIWSFFNNESFEETVLTAVNLGGDTDTIAAIVGGLAGIFYGYEKIPNGWIQNMIRKEDIMNLCDKFYGAVTDDIMMTIKNEMDELLNELSGGKDGK